jgi:hypothetical protein
VYICAFSINVQATLLPILFQCELIFIKQIQASSAGALSAHEMVQEIGWALGRGGDFMHICHLQIWKMMETPTRNKGGIKIHPINKHFRGMDDNNAIISFPSLFPLLPNRLPRIIAHFREKGEEGSGGVEWSFWRFTEEGRRRYRKHTFFSR